MEAASEDTIMAPAMTDTETTVLQQPGNETDTAVAPNAKRPRLEKGGSSQADQGAAPRREGEEELFTRLTEDQWTTLEEGLRRSELQLVFWMTGQSVQVGNFYMRLKDLDRDIVDECRKNGVEFEDDTLFAVGTQEPMLVGSPSSKTRKLWTLMKKGYIDVRGVHVWLQPSFTGRVVSNLTMNEIEYQNVNEVQPSALVQMLQGWGATDVIVVSHATNMGVRGRLPAIMCLKSVARTSPDLLFAFRLFFPSEEEATRVYANYLAARQATAHGAPETEKTTTALKPVSNVSWDRKRSEFFRPTSREYAEAAEKQVKIFGLTMEITTRKLEEAMRAHGYPAMDVLIKGPRRNWAEAEMRMKGQVDELLKEYGPDSSEKIRVGNHVLRFVRGENPQERICFQCHQPGHFRNQCPELQPKPTIGQAVRGQVGHEVAQSNTDAVTVTNSEVAMRMMKNMATQIVDERTSRLEEKLDRNMQSLAVRVDANEVQQHEVSRKMNTLAESFQQTITAAVQSAVQAAVAQVMQQGQQELQRTEPDFQRGLPSHQ